MRVAALAILIALEWFNLIPFYLAGWLTLILSGVLLYINERDTLTDKAVQLFAGAFVGGTILYFGLLIFLGQPVGYAFRMIMYPALHPFSYIALLSISYALIGTLWVASLESRKSAGWHKMMLFILPLISVLAAAPFGGMLWVLNDWQHGFVPDTPRAIDAMIWGAKTGVFAGPLMFVISQPLSTLAVIFGALWLQRHTPLSHP